MNMGAFGISLVCDAVELLDDNVDDMTGCAQKAPGMAR